MTLIESTPLQLRLEAFNAFNHAQFYGAAAVDGNISSANFGRIIAAAAPRLVQLDLKFLSDLSGGGSALTCVLG